MLNSCVGVEIVWGVNRGVIGIERDTASRGRPAQPGSSRRTVVTRSMLRSNDAMTPTPVRSALATR